MAKYRRLRERVELELLGPGDRLVEPPAATVEELCRAHHPDYVRRAIGGELTVAEIRRIGFPWSPQLIERSRRSSGATLMGARAALQEGCAINLAGGTHHAFADCGEGYCIFNDAAVTIRNLVALGEIRSAIVIDLDVHQGNGTASILADDSTGFTFSIHGAKNFPFRKVPSDWDVPLPDGTGDTPYLAALQESLVPALNRALPDLAIYLAGADPFERDRLGRFKLTQSGLADRDTLVFQTLRERKIPVVVAMAGGYAADVEEIVAIHFQTIKLAQQFFGQ